MKPANIITGILLFLIGMVCMGFAMDVTSHSSNHPEITDYLVSCPEQAPVYHYYNSTEVILLNKTEITHVHYEGYEGFPLREDHECGWRAEKHNIHGQSMHPLVSDGHAWVEPVKWKDIRVGDVVVIDRGNHTILHALIYKNKDFAHSRGYNNPTKDKGRITPEMVEWRYCVK